MTCYSYPAGGGYTGEETPRLIDGNGYTPGTDEPAPGAPDSPAGSWAAALASLTAVLLRIDERLSDLEAVVADAVAPPPGCDCLCPACEGCRDRDERCRHGHLRTPENTYISPSGRRDCRPCRATSQRRRDRSRRAARAAARPDQLEDRL